MEILLEAAFNQKMKELENQEIEFEIDLDQIDDMGNLFLRYDPPIAAVPNDWD